MISQATTLERFCCPQLISRKVNLSHLTPLIVSAVPADRFRTRAERGDRNDDRDDEIPVIVGGGGRELDRVIH